MSSGSEGSYKTTVQSSYQQPAMERKNCTGQRQKIITKNLYEVVNAHLCSEQTSGEPPIVYTSTTHHDYSKTTEGIMTPSYLTSSVLKCLTLCRCGKAAIQ